MLKSVTVTFIPLRHCLINLPGAWANALLDQGKVLLDLHRDTTEREQCGVRIVCLFFCA